jgi:hypothetical protein
MGNSPLSVRSTTVHMLHTLDYRDRRNPTHFTDSEDRFLHWVRSVVEEAYAIVDFEDESEIPPDFRDPES